MNEQLTLKQIDEQLQNLAYTKIYKETQRLFNNNLKLKNIEIILKNRGFNCDNFGEFSFSIKLFISNFSELLTDNILDNFNYSYNKIYYILNNDKKLKREILEELIYYKYCEE